MKLADGKGLGGKGRLLHGEIDQFQLFYGQAIRKNLSGVKAIKDAILAIYYHRLSSDKSSHHELCPTGPDTWWKFNKAKELNLPYEHDHSLPAAVMEAIEPIFNDLTKNDLLKKCLHGMTQNPNESLNSEIWHRLPKPVYVGLETLRLGTRDAVLSLNEGSISEANVLKRLGIVPGKLTMQGLLGIDSVRIKKADKEVKEINMKRRMQRRQMKSKREGNLTISVNEAFFLLSWFFQSSVVIM